MQTAASAGGVIFSARHHVVLQHFSGRLLNIITQEQIVITIHMIHIWLDAELAAPILGAYLKKMLFISLLKGFFFLGGPWDYCPCTM